MAKDSPRTTAGELQKILESRGQKTLHLKKNCHTAPTSPHVVWEGFKKKYSTSIKNKLQHIQLSDTTETSNWTGFYVQVKLFFMLWAYISTVGPHGFYQIPTDKKIDK